MTDQIFLLRDNEELVTLTATDYDAEAVLQALIAKYPSLLPIDEGDVASLLFVLREASIPNDSEKLRFALDHLFLDRAGVPTLVEVKRASDTRTRREVVAQMLDYASHFVVHWTVERIRTEFEQTHEQAEQVLDEFLIDGDATSFWQMVKTNLQAKRIRMLFVADHIPAELRRIVEFLNEQMDPAEVLAVEIPQYTSQGVRTYVPRLIGQTVAAKERKSPSSQEKHQWDEPSFMAELESHQSTSAAQTAKAILTWAQEQKLDVWWGQGIRNGSFVPRLLVNGEKHFTFACWTTGYVEIYFQHLRGRAPFDDLEKRTLLWRRLNAIPGVVLPKDSIERRPSIEIGQLVTADALQQFLAVWKWYLDEVRATQQ